MLEHSAIWACAVGNCPRGWQKASFWLSEYFTYPNGPGDKGVRITEAQLYWIAKIEPLYLQLVGACKDYIPTHNLVCTLFVTSVHMLSTSLFPIFSQNVLHLYNNLWLDDWVSCDCPITLFYVVVGVAFVTRPMFSCRPPRWSNILCLCIRAWIHSDSLFRRGCNCLEIVPRVLSCACMRIQQNSQGSAMEKWEK